jgi:phosphoribosylglycinamide formyltransferase-1
MKIGILISGRGSNMLAIAEAVRSGAIPDSEATIVISDKPDAPGIEKAKALGIETLVILKGDRKRVEHDAEVAAELKKRGVELVCLAGYMRLLSPEFIHEFPDKIVNIHPSLLPSFKGLDAQKQAFDYGVKYTGCTVHFVDEALDHGVIIAQKVIEVLDTDTVETLSARILEEEHKLYTQSIALIAKGKYNIDERRLKRL